MMIWQDLRQQAESLRLYNVGRCPTLYNCRLPYALKGHYKDDLLTYALSGLGLWVYTMT